VRSSRSRYAEKDRLAAGTPRMYVNRLHGHEHELRGHYRIAAFRPVFVIRFSNGPGVNRFWES